MTIKIHRGDLPSDFVVGKAIAVDTETMGLHFGRDRLCLVQVSTGDGRADLIQIVNESDDAPNLKRVLADPDIVKIFHFARFDMAALKKRFDVMAKPVYCTKIASFLARTYTNQHGLKALVQEFMDISLEKHKQSSDWGNPELSKEQCVYAAGDVLHLHELRHCLDMILKREERLELAQNCFEFLPVRVMLDLKGWAACDIFSH